MYTSGAVSVCVCCVRVCIINHAHILNRLSSIMWKYMTRNLPTHALCIIGPQYHSFVYFYCNTASMWNPPPAHHSTSYSLSSIRLALVQ